MSKANPGEGKVALMAFLSLMGIKIATVLDDEETRCALAFRVQPDKDVIIISNAQGKDMDPIVRETSFPLGHLPTTSKLGIDATIPPDIDRLEYEKAIPFGCKKVDLRQE